MIKWFFGDTPRHTFLMPSVRHFCSLSFFSFLFFSSFVVPFYILFDRVTFVTTGRLRDGVRRDVTPGYHCLCVQRLVSYYRWTLDPCVCSLLLGVEIPRCNQILNIWCGDADRRDFSSQLGHGLAGRAGDRRTICEYCNSSPERHLNTSQHPVAMQSLCRHPFTFCSSLKISLSHSRRAVYRTNLSHSALFLEIIP